MRNLDVQQIRFSSKKENIHLVEKFVEEICDYFNVSNDYFPNILIAVTEAVNNAIEHGSLLNPEKNVYVSFLPNEGYLTFLVRDEGDGFNYQSIPDPTDPEAEDTPTGRGLFVMKALADDVKFHDNGRKIELNFNINNINSRITEYRIQQFLEHQAEKERASKKTPKA
ncbi:MAG: ATP-binding protein, partial [Bacteroidota bacterium]